MKPNSVSIATGTTLPRRTLLRGAGIAMALPFLDAMRPAFAANPAGPKAKRFVGISLSLGLHNPNLVPLGTKGDGTTYTPSPYLKPLQDLRKNFTVVSGSSHPGVVGGHTAEGSIWSACPNERGSTKRNTVSLDQLMAKHLGHHTRYPSLVINTSKTSSPNYTENGAMIPAINNPVTLFKHLFQNDSAAERARQAELFRRGQSVMDVIGAEAKTLQGQLGPGDRDKLDAWFTSVRELEKRLHANEAWVHKPKPTVKATAPRNVDNTNAAEIVKAFLDVMALGLQTDSSRFMTLHITGLRVNGIKGIDESYHGLSHHGKDGEKIDQLTIVEQAILNRWGDFLRTLKSSKATQGTLLDDTMVLLTSNLGNASSHDNRNMPVLFAGGGFKHGRHLAFDTKRNEPLPNLYVNALQQLGLEFDQFATSRGTLRGLV